MVVTPWVLAMLGLTPPASGAGAAWPPRGSHRFDRIPKSSPRSVSPLPNWGYTSVMDYHAAGDGATDDTQAFQAALDAAAANGTALVLVPGGTFAIRGSLVVHANTELRGVADYPYRSWGSPGGHPAGSTLLAYAGKGSEEGLPFITLGGPNAAVTGLNVYYPEQNSSQTPTPYPPCIRPLALGITVDQCYDIGRIRHIHFWPFWADPTTAATKWQVIDDVFSWGYSRVSPQPSPVLCCRWVSLLRTHLLQGMVFTASKDGACNGQFTDINFDDVDIGVEVQASQPWGLMFQNLNLANAGDGMHRQGQDLIAVDLSNGTMPFGHNSDPSLRPTVVVRGGSFWGAEDIEVEWDCPGTMTLSDSIFNHWAGSAAVMVNGG
eukprot:gene6158-1101_t